MHFGHARRLEVTLVQPGEAQAPPVVDAILSVMDCLFSALELESK